MNPSHKTRSGFADGGCYLIFFLNFHSNQIKELLANLSHISKTIHRNSVAGIESYGISTATWPQTAVCESRKRGVNGSFILLF